MVMGINDTSYEDRVDKNTQRKIISLGLDDKSGQQEKVTAS